MPLMTRIGKAGKIDRKDVRQVEPGWYQVRSQSLSYESWYDVVSTEKGLQCDCPDNRLNKNKCKHIFSVETIYLHSTHGQFESPFQEMAEITKTINPIHQVCTSCGSINIRKNGYRSNKMKKVQRYECNTCHARFTGNIGFSRMRALPETITVSMQLYFTGTSYRNIVKYLKLRGYDYTHVSIYNWIKKYVSLLDSYVDTLRPSVGNKWHADEIWLKIRGDRKYLFAMMDHKTRFLLAQEVANTKFSHNAKKLLKMGRDVAGITPVEFVTDGLPAYNDAFKKNISK